MTRTIRIKMPAELHAEILKRMNWCRVRGLSYAFCACAVLLLSLPQDTLITLVRRVRAGCEDGEDLADVIAAVAGLVGKRHAPDDAGPPVTLTAEDEAVLQWLEEQFDGQSPA